MKQYHISNNVFVRTDWPQNDKASSKHHVVELWLSTEAALDLQDELDSVDLVPNTVRRIRKALEFALGGNRG